MSQKYIDFVPSKKPSAQPAAPRAAKSTAAPRTANSAKSAESTAPHQSQSRPTAHSRTTASRRASTRKSAQSPAVQDYSPAASDTFSLKKEPVYGVIEDFHPKFVNAEVEKRPLSRSHFTPQVSELTELKSRKVGKGTRKATAATAASAVAADNQALHIPKSPFISKAKVSKRPLSKNVYAKPVQPTKEPAAGPVTIISDSKSESKGSMVIAIILTIILGAVAGTIAFLIMPK
ncbi:hypothetical protein IIY66_01610 [Candidatus Saccharibacteria bacterium]|nr:hypothetical protein [Candidatus Saccharibacteria bacterium]